MKDFLNMFVKFLLFVGFIVFGGSALGLVIYFIFTFLVPEQFKQTILEGVNSLENHAPAVVRYYSPEKKGKKGYSCNCSKTCKRIKTCEEAQYQLDICGCSKRDGDKDGVACDNMCQ